MLWFKQLFVLIHNYNVHYEGEEEKLVEHYSEIYVVVNVNTFNEKEKNVTFRNFICAYRLKLRLLKAFLM